MLTAQLINNDIPRLQLQDSVSKALQLISDFRVTHLPVVESEKLLGLISEDDLLDAEETKLPIETLQNSFIKVAVLDNEHFLNAVSKLNQIESTVVPVTNEQNDLLGVITASDLLSALGNFAGTNEMGGLIVLEIERAHFSISEISRIVESNDATILHLNTTMNTETGLLAITLHIDKKNISAIIATFERYDYLVIYSLGNDKFENDIHTNYRHLMNYLDI